MEKFFDRAWLYDKNESCQAVDHYQSLYFMLTSQPPNAEAPLATQRSHEVARTLETAILSGEHAIGSRLPSEEKLGKQFGVSRTVVREAIQQLTSKGLITTKVGSGSYVTEYGADNLKSAFQYYSVLSADAKAYHELFALRFLIEIECVRCLTAPGQEQALSQVWEQLERMRRSVGNPLVFTAADIAFHKAVVDAAGNRLFSALFVSLQPLLERYVEVTLPEDGWSEKVLQDHQDIFEAIRSGREAAAVRALRHHLRDSLAHYDLVMKKGRDAGNDAH